VPTKSTGNELPTGLIIADSTELYPDGSPNNADASARCSYAREAVYGFKEMKETEASDVDE